MDPGVFQRPAFRSVSLPDVIPLVALRSPSRTSLAILDTFPDPSATNGPFCASYLPWVLPPLRRSQRAESTSRNPVPRQPRLVRCRAPRRGVPPPLRAAFAVFHDLDGLRLRAPCDLFQPLTPMGLGSRLPAGGPEGSRALRRPSEDVRFRTQGVGGAHPGGSRLGRSIRDLCHAPFAPPLWSRATSPAPAPRPVRLGPRPLPVATPPEGDVAAIA
jgi:hypothetical protein